MTEAVFGVPQGHYEQLLARMRSARSLMFFSGAGLSAQSGIPTFRDDDTGMWTKLTPKEYASAEGFRKEKLKVWQWYWDRKQAAQACSPNDAHRAIARLQQHYPSYIITQNVDGLLTAAGCKDVQEMHGSLSGYKCFACARPALHAERYTRDAVPQCEHCGGPMRPAVVWFGELLDNAMMKAAQNAAKRSDVFFCIGTSGDVYPAASLPELAAKWHRPVVIVNPKPTALDLLTPHCYRATATDFMNKLLEDLAL